MSDETDNQPALPVNNILVGDALAIAKALPSESVHCIVTSPPYYGLRDYGVDGQMGKESTPDEYVENMVVLFRELRRVLRSDGTLWLNIGDSYAGSGKGRLFDGSSAVTSEKQLTNKGTILGKIEKSYAGNDIKPKDLIGIPWLLAFALRADGWYLRQEIIWHKPNPMPESVRDRPTRAHEQIFLFSKSARYYYDSEAIAEPISEVSKKRISQPSFANQTGGPKDYRNGANPNRSMRKTIENFAANNVQRRNKRSVWTITTKGFKGAHFAVFPTDLIRPCILAGCPEKCCSQCGAPYQRRVERDLVNTEGWGKAEKDHHAGIHGSDAIARNGQGRAGDSITKTLGFEPSCNCNTESKYGLNTSRPQARRAIELFEEKGLTEAHLDAIRSVGLADTNRSKATMDGAGKNTDEKQRLADEAKAALGGYYREFTFRKQSLSDPERTCDHHAEPVGGIVLDPFIGSGTTAVVAKEEGRNWLGFELNPDYAAMAINRINEPKKPKKQPKIKHSEQQLSLPLGETGD